MNGTLPNSDKSTTDVKMLQNVNQAIHFQFDEKGKITDMVVIYNSDDFTRQVK